jgi:hypothetical protein
MPLAATAPWRPSQASAGKARRTSRAYVQGPSPASTSAHGVSAIAASNAGPAPPSTQVAMVRIRSGSPASITAV